MTTQNLFVDSEHQMKKTIEKLVADFSKVRTGRASPGLLETVRVDYYGALVPVHQVGNVAVTDARTIEIRPWDTSVLGELEKAIVKANIGVTPNNDGKVVRLNFPPLTEERRKEMVKIIKKIAEEFRVAVRNIRREAIEKIKQAEKNKEISQDDKSHHEDHVQGLTNAYIKRVDDLLAAKEKDILEI